MHQDDGNKGDWDLSVKVAAVNRAQECGRGPTVFIASYSRFETANKLFETMYIRLPSH